MAKPVKKKSIPVSRIAIWKSLVLVFAGVMLAWQVLGIARVKVRQHIRVIPSAPLAPQGEGDGKVSALVDFKAGPGGILYTLSSYPKYYFLQRFGTSFVFEASTHFIQKISPNLTDPVAMAILPDGEIFIAQKNGRVIKLDSAFKGHGEMKLEVGEIRAMTCARDGRLLVLDSLARKVLIFSREGAFLSEFGAKKLTSPKALAVTAEGRAAVLDEIKDAYVIKVFGSDSRFERAIPVSNLGSSPPVTMAPAGAERVSINDAPGARGVLFYDVALGRFFGETLGAEGSQEPIIHPGYVGGDAMTGDVYLHFGPGLLKCRLPEP